MGTSSSRHGLLLITIKDTLVACHMLREKEFSNFHYQRDEILIVKLVHWAVIPSRLPREYLDSYRWCICGCT